MVQEERLHLAPAGMGLVAKPFGSCRSLVAPGAQTRRQVLSLSLNATKSLLVGAKLLVST